MKKIRNRALSLVLTLCMVLSMLPIGAVTAKAVGEGVTLGSATGWNSTARTFQLGTATIGVNDITALQVNVTEGTVAAGNTAGWTALTNIAKDSLTLYGTAKTGTEAAAVLQRLTFTMLGASMDVNVTATTKVTTITAGSGTTITKGNVTALKDHYYMYVPAADISWLSAYAAAKTNIFMGMKGYLATITSEDENKVLTAISKEGAWSGGAGLASGVSFDADALTIGGTPIGEYGANGSVETGAYLGTGFVWACGPEAGESYYTLRHCPTADNNIYNPTTHPDTGNTANKYNNWTRSVGYQYPEPTGGDPNKELKTWESCMQVNHSSNATKGGTWNDLTPIQVSNSNVKGYFVEFGGYTDPGKPDPGASTSTGKADYTGTGTFTAASLDTVVLTVNPGKGMTVAGSPLTIAPNAQIAANAITVTAKNGYVLPESYDMGNGLQFTKNPDGTGKVTGSIAAAVTVTITDAKGISLGAFSPSSSAFQLPSADVSVGGGVTALQVTVTGGTVTAGTTDWTALSNYGNTSLTLYGTSAKSDTDATALLRALNFKGTSTSMTINVTATTKTTSITAGENRKLTAGTGSLAGHYYMYVPSSDTSWINSYNAAKQNTFMGMRGYLATITSEQEDKLLTSISTKGAWSGGAALTSNSSDSATAPTGFGGPDFQWACGPEADTVYYTSRWHNIKNDATGIYNNWYRQTEVKFGEPNNGNSNNVRPNPDDWEKQEPCMQVNFSGSGAKAWNDVPEPGKAGSTAYTTGYFVEFGGYEGTKDPGYEASKLQKDYTATKTFAVDLSNTWKVNITLGTNMTAASDGGALSQSPTKGQPITEIKLTAKTGYTMPETWTDASLNGLAYTRGADPFTTATISGTPTNTVTATVPAADANHYTVTYNTHGGSAVATTDHVYGTSSALSTTVPTKAGYTFKGWYDAETGGNPVAAALNLTAVSNGTYELHAQWTALPYAVTLTLDGVTAAGKTDGYTINDPVSITLTADTGFTVPATLSGDTLAAAGLTYTAAEGKKTAAIMGNIKKAATATVTAEYTVTVTAGAGETLGANATQTKAKGTAIDPISVTTTDLYTLPATYTDSGTGLMFTKADATHGTIAGSPGKSGTMALKDATRNQYTVTITAGANTNALTNGTQTVDTTTAITAIAVKAADGFTLPKDWAVGHGLTYLRTAHNTATITGVPTGTFNAAVPAAAAIPTHTVTYTLTGLKTEPVGAATVSEKDTTLSFTLKPAAAGQAVLPADIGVTVKGVAIAKGTAGNHYTYNAVTGVVTITYTRAEGDNGLTGFDDAVVVTAKAVAIPQITVEPGTGGVGTQIKVTPEVDTGFTIDKVVVAATPADITLEPPYAITPEIIGGLKTPANITVTVTGPDGIKVTTKTTVAVTTLNSVTKNTASGKTVAAGGVTTVANPAVSSLTAPLISVTPISSTYTTTGVGDGTGAIVADKTTTFAKESTVLTAAPNAGAYFDGFYVNGTKVTAENVVATLGAGATLSVDGKTLTYTPAGTDKKIAVAYRNLLGEVNAKGSTPGDIEAVLKDPKFVTIFDGAAAAKGSYDNISTGSKLKIWALLDTMTGEGYTKLTLETTFTNVVNLLSLVSIDAGLVPGDFTTGSWAQEQAALKAANDLLGEKDPAKITPEKLRAVKTTLETAIKSLQWKTLTLLIKAPANRIGQITVPDIQTTKPAVDVATLALNEDPSALESKSYFPVIGTGATIKIAKSDLAEDDVFAATVNGNALKFTAGTGTDSDKYVTVIPPMQESTTVLFTFAKKRVEVVLPTVTTAKVSIDGKEKPTNGKNLVKNLKEDIVITIAPKPGQMVVPCEVKVTIVPDEVLVAEAAPLALWTGDGAIALADTEYTAQLKADGTILIPADKVTGKVTVGNLQSAVEPVTVGLVEYLVKNLEDKYKNNQKDYTPETIDNLNKAIKKAQELLLTTDPSVDALSAVYKAVVDAESALKGQLSVTLPAGISPVVNVADKPAGWNDAVYGTGTTAEYVAPGVVKVVTASPAKTEYFVREGYSVKLEGTASAADKTVSKITYHDGTTHDVVTQQGQGQKYTFTIPTVTLPITSVTPTETGKTIVIIPGKIIGPDTLQPGTVTGGGSSGGGTGATTVDPGKGGKVTEITVDKKVITLPTDDLLKKIKEEITKKNDESKLTAPSTITPTTPIPGIDGGIKVTTITGTAPNVTGATVEVTLQPDGNKATITITPTPAPGAITAVTVLPKVSPDPADPFKEITVEPGTGKVTVTFPDTDKGTHEVGGKTDHKTHPLPKGDVKFPGETVIGTITAKNDPALPSIDPNTGIENRDVVVTITPKTPNEVLTGGGIKYVITDPVTGVETPTTITLPGDAATTGTAVVDPDTGVITVTIPGKNVTGEITFPDLGKNIVDPDTKKLDDLLKGAEKLLEQKDKGTFVPADPAQGKWDAIDKSKVSPESIAKKVQDIVDAVKNGTSPAPTEPEKKKAIDDLNKAIEEITKTRNEVSTIPAGGGGSKPDVPDVGTGVKVPGTITTPGGGDGSSGGTDGKLTMPDDELVITGITTDPGFVPEKVVVTITDPVTGKETRVEVPLVPGTDGNLSGISPYTATIPGTNTVSTTPATKGKTLKDVLKELKPGDITGIQVAGKKEGITLPTADAIKDASNTNTGHKNDNSSGKSSAISAVTLTPAGSALPKDSGLVITATLGSDDYTQSTVANAVNCPYEFVGVKVDGKVLELGKDYTVDLTTQPGKAIVTFTKAQLKKIAPDQDLGAIELLTKPTNPQYKTFVDDYQKLNDLFDRYKKPDATAKDKAVFEELVSKLNNQLTTTDAGVLAKTEQLTEDNKANLVSQQAQLQAYDSAITAKKAASDVSTAIDAMYRQLEQDVKAAGGTLPVGDTVTGSLAAAILKNKSAIDSVTKAYNALTGAQKAQVNTDQNTKRTTAANALAAAEKGTKTPGEIARELIGKLPDPTDVLKDSTKPASGLKDRNGTTPDANNKYGIDSTKPSSDGDSDANNDNAAALTELEQLHQDLLAAEKAAKQPGAALTVPEAKKLSDLRAAVETEYEDYAKRFAKDHLTDKDGTLGSPAVPTDGTYPDGKITDWVKYPSELTALKKKYDQLPAKVQQEIDKVMAPDCIGDIFKEVFPDVNDLDAVGTATILDELDTDPGAGKVYVKLADLDSTTVVGGSGKTGKEWVESIVKTYEKYRDIPEAEKENVNKALAPETMENLYSKAKDQSSNSAESQKAATDFIKKHLTDGGKTILTATDGNKGKITGGEGDWANLSFGAQKAINDKLTALGGKSYPALVADAKALDSGSSGGGSGSSGSGSGGGSSRPVTVTVDPGKDGGGKVTLSPKNPKPGEEVTITVTPEPGFQIDTVLITDKNGKELPKLGSNPFTIIAPADGFTVKSTFKKADKVDGQVGPFADVSDKAWYAPAVDFVYMEGLFKGISETQFGPAVTMNRGMFITVLGRLAKVDTDKWSATGKFPDVASDAYYAPYVAWGAAEGIVLGYDNGNYGPEDLVTREQMAAILYRYVQKQGGGYQGNWVFLLPYADAASVSDWALEGISWCSQHKVVQGKENNRLDPTGNASRAEVAQLMMNYCNLKPAN